MELGKLKNMYVFGEILREISKINLTFSKFLTPDFLDFSTVGFLKFLAPDLKESCYNTIN